MFLYGAAVLVLLINKNAAETSDSATTAVSSKHERAAFDKGELARLIHHVLEADDDDAAENFDNENGERKVTQYEAAEPLDLSYFDIRLNGALKSSSKVIISLLKKNLVANQAQKATPTSDYEVRLHPIKNPEVLQQYRKNLRKRHMSTSSSSGYDDSLEYDRHAEQFIRRNAVFRLGEPLDQAFRRENPKLALRNGVNMGEERYKKKPREEEKSTEKILVSFEETKLDDNDKPRHSDNKLNRNKNNYNDEPAKKDIWDDIAKNAHKWDNKQDKNSGQYKKDKYNDDYKNDNYKKIDDYKKRDGYGNLNKERYGGYVSWKSKASKPKNGKSDDQDKKIDWDKPKKENSYDKWKSKSMEQADSNKRGNNGWNEPKKSDDWGKSKKNNDWDKPKENDEWDKPKKNDEWDKPKKNDEWDKPKKNDEWDKPKKNDEWDKPKKNNEWDKPKKNNDWDKPSNADSWDQPKRATKGIASFERELKNNYNEKADFKREEKKKTKNEWDRAVANSGGGSGTANRKPFKPKISDYYNPRPRKHENPSLKSFGRTSIPFVGKKGIYEEK